MGRKRACDAAVGTLHLEQNHGASMPRTAKTPPFSLGTDTFCMGAIGDHPGTCGSWSTGYSRLVCSLSRNLIIKALKRTPGGAQATKYQSVACHPMLVPYLGCARGDLIKTNDIHL